ncbi:DUF4191 domain-containing protein [Corynebacterium lactis]|uniref:Membrane protein n=1 Tax=Corynebacterium lactis RW2-5 TaxID=1408189 RepID=A0A0K2H159_9CORY|nr:DUF4191 domain-containing protein [Corynebacterium lactis]ALA67688.1 membrane protein [Corynebacterium lactis RW2-5]
MATNPDPKEVKKAQRAAKRAQRKQTRGQMWQAFKLQKSRDSKLVPYMALGFFAPIVLLLIIGLVIGGAWAWVLPIIGISLGIMAAMYIFTKRLEASFYSEAEGQAGAAAWALDNMRSGVGMVWHVKTGAQANQHMDAVHRVVGNPGIVLVGEGDQHRVRQLIGREKKALSRIAGDTPIYDMIAGSGEGEVAVKSLQRELMRLPRNLNKDQANALNERLQSMDRIRDARANMPKGPLPKGANAQAGMNRRARRAANRNKNH